ncbi:GTPase [Pseudomonas sp. MAP12]|uniref:GTPase n=1 Tax=Geopseudomonas aromaticivorans TaxID=2849492 RepID=A0ABS6MRN2_9GAMM|nr:GTPase [Pseudomonas aromaticivorans]MBV2131467.1 GTPase [Pseudomonas aromaticivorans]
MSESLPLILEDAHGERRETHSARIGVRLEGRELWLEADGMGGVTIYAESVEGETEIPLLVVRPQAVNQLSLSVELEAAEAHEHDHEHGADCGCDHH